MTFERCGWAPWRREYSRAAAWSVIVFATALSGHAQDGTIDPKRLLQLMKAGDYRAAIAEAKTLEEDVRPKSKEGAGYAPRVRDSVELLVLQAGLERRIGELDAADQAVNAAYKAFTEREFQRRLSQAAKAGGAAAGALVPFELVGVGLLNEWMEILLERLRRDGASAEPDQVAGWLKKFEELSAQAAAARQGLADRLAKADDAIKNAPRPRLIASDVPTLQQQGRFSLVKTRLPATDEAAAKAGRDEAVAKLAKAVQQADALFAAPAAGAAADKAVALDRQQEADLIRAELLESLAEAELFAGEPERAQKSIERALELRRTATAEAHPDLIRPTIIQAGIAESRRRADAAAGQSLPAREQAKVVAELCSAATDLLKQHDKTFSPQWPWRAALAAVAKKVQPDAATAPRDPAVADSVDAATQRVMPLIRVLP